MADPRSSLPPGRRGLVFPFHAVAHRDLPLHRHRGLELNLVTRGSGRFLVGGRQALLAARALLWLPPRTPHLLLETSRRFHMWVVWTRERPPRPPGDGHVRILTADATRRLDALCGVAAEQQDDPGRADATLAAILGEAAHGWGRAERIPAEGPVHPAVEAAARLVQERHGALGLEEVAAAVHLSRSRLSRLFAAQTGVRLLDHRNRCRLDRFLQLRRERPRETLLSLALESGFGSYMQCYRVHRRLTGRPPAATQCPAPAAVYPLP